MYLEQGGSCNATGKRVVWLDHNMEYVAGHRQRVQAARVVCYNI